MTLTFKSSRGQIAIEFMIVLICIVAIILIFMPIVSKVYSQTNEKLMQTQAEYNLELIKQNIELIEEFEDNSSIEKEIKTKNEFKIICKDNELKIIYPLIEKIATTTANCNINIEIYKNSKIIIEKKNKTINITLT